MHWKIIKENPRKYADRTYYLKAERDCPEGKLLLETRFIEGFMYDLTVRLLLNKPQRKFLIFQYNKPIILYSCLVFQNDRIEKYGHQIMRMTKVHPIRRLKRLDELQKDSVLNFAIGTKYNLDFITDLPKKD